MKALILLAILLSPLFVFSQSDLEKVIKGGEILLSGLSILKTARSDDKRKNAKVVESVCVKNKLVQKVTFRLIGSDDEGNEINKELVVPKDGKECLFEIPKTIYTYEFVLSTGEAYKKGEYRLEEGVTYTIKDP